MTTDNVKWLAGEETASGEPIVPDPVVVRLERELEEAVRLMNVYAKSLVEADASLADRVKERDAARLGWDGEIKIAAGFKRERDEARAELTCLRALLREALEAADCDDDEWWGNEIPDEWFVRAKAALEGKP